MERGESGGGFSEGVLGILRPQKITTPVGLVVVTGRCRRKSGEFLNSNVLTWPLDSGVIAEVRLTLCSAVDRKPSILWT